MTENQQNTTHFGFKDVPVASKASLVKGVFDSVASRYDVMNNVMSLGTHHLWKDKAISILDPKPNSTLLDVAGGTGDIAFRFLKRAMGGKVTVCDINHAMLEQGRDRAINQGIVQGIEWVCGNAESLPVPDRSVDYYTIAFGIRNVTHIDKALAEAHRVLKPGGKFLCLEFSRVDNPLLAMAYDTYSFKLIPLLGKWVARDAASYQYLVESIRKFPPQEKFARMIKAAGFTQVDYQNLTGGMVAVHTGWKI